MRPTKAGKRRQFITIQQLSTTADAYGEPVATWSSFATAYAAVKQLSGRELFYAQLQVQALATHEVNLRYVVGVTPEMQISIEGGPTLQIVDVNDVEYRHRELVLICVQKK